MVRVQRNRSFPTFLSLPLRISSVPFRCTGSIWQHTVTESVVVFFSGPAFKRVARDSPSTLAVGVGSGVTLTAASGSPTPAPAFAGLAPGLRGLVPPELYTSAGPTAPLLNR